MFSQKYLSSPLLSFSLATFEHFTNWERTAAGVLFFRLYKNLLFHLVFNFISNIYIKSKNGCTSNVRVYEYVQMHSYFVYCCFVSLLAEPFWFSGYSYSFFSMYEAVMWEGVKWFSATCTSDDLSGSSHMKVRHLSPLPAPPPHTSVSSDFRSSGDEVRTLPECCVDTQLWTVDS